MEVSSFRLMATFLLIINSNKEKFESFTIGEYSIAQKTWSKYSVLLQFFVVSHRSYYWPRFRAHFRALFFLLINSALFRARIRARKYLLYAPIFGAINIYCWGLYGALIGALLRGL